MKLAILSDIHSNYPALKAVIKEIDNRKIDTIIILGDIFGYYPWAVETYRLVQNICPIIIAGNHDNLLIQKKQNLPKPDYIKILCKSRKQLLEKTPDALLWISNMAQKKEIIIDNLKISLYHGSPSSPLNGRYYPDNRNTYKWFPSKKEIVMLGNTHYPLFRKLPSGGIILNPGSVGQPRDGITIPCWGIFDTQNIEFRIIRTPYNLLKTVNLLKEMHWQKKFINLLLKNYSGKY